MTSTRDFLRSLASPVAYEYDGGIHCPYCTLGAIGRNHAGEIAGRDEQGFWPRDQEGKIVAAVPYDDRDYCDGRTCDTCSAHLEHGYKIGFTPEPFPRYIGDGEWTYQA